MRKLLVLPLLLLSLVSSAQNFEWAKVLIEGPWSGSEIYDMFPDKYGNFYITGSIDSTRTFDPSGINITLNGGFEDSFVAKLSSNGNIIWVKSNQSQYNDRSLSVFVDQFQNVYLTGNFYDSMDVNTGIGIEYIYSNGGGKDIFVQKLDINGDLVWAKSFGGICSSCNEEGRDIEVDDSGNIYVTGIFSGQVDFDPGADTFIVNGQGIGYYDNFLLKLDSAGNFEWVNHFKRSGTLRQNRICLTNHGTILYSGTFTGTIDVDPGPDTINIISTGGDIFLIELSESGQIITTKVLGGASGGQDLQDLKLDSIGNVLMTGYYLNSADFDPAPGPVHNGSIYENCFLVKLDSALNYIWSKSFGGTHNTVGTEIKTDRLNNIYITGIFLGNTDFDPEIGINNIVTKGGYDIFTSKFSKDGDYFWTSTIGDSSDNDRTEMIVDEFGNIFRIGSFRHTIDFNPDTLPSDTLYLSNFDFGASNNESIFIQKFSQDICDQLYFSVDSVSSISCNNQGYSSVSIYPNSGYNIYSWNTFPTQSDYFAQFTYPGIYNIIATDTINNCDFQKSVLINGPAQIGIDLTTYLSPNNFRPSFASNIWLHANNLACTPVSGTLSCVLAPLVNFNSSIPPPDLISGDTLFWNFTDLTYDSLHITPVINVTTTGQIGDTVCFEVMINPISGDADSSNNYKSYCFPVINGYDPNDKQVYPQGECIPNYVLNGEPLTYTVRFQNTGNADAINIHILDTLDADLDLNSLRVIGNSHYLITEILPGNVMKFRFDNIHLPDSGTNELLSHGYVIYEVKPLAGTPDYTLIENTSHIYFDFNPAIITNTTGNTLVDSIPISFSTNENISVCFDSDYTLPDGTVYTNIIAPISHQSYLWMVDGCDSIITTNISVLNPIDTGVTTLQEIFGLESQAIGMNYQWYDCQSQLPLAGETSQTLSSVPPSEYFVIINDGNCSDTSACYAAGTIGINENQISGLNIYPNPAKNILVIEQNSNSKLSIEILNIEGRLIQSFTSSEKNIKTDVSQFANGMYFINVKSETGNGVYKLVKE